MSDDKKPEQGKKTKQPPAEENLELFEDSFSADLLEHLPDISDEAKAKWPRDLVALLDIYSATLKKFGYADDIAEKITYSLLAALSAYCGGRYIYLPKRDALEVAIRDVKLFHDWSQKHMTHEELSAKYKLSIQHVYRVINKQKQYHLNKVQPQLF